MNGDWPGELKPKRVVFPMAGKGGVGKTTVMATLAEWYTSNGFKVAMFDMDPDNKAEGCFKALARALRVAVELDPKTHGHAPSTKGVL